MTIRVHDESTKLRQVYNFLNESLLKGHRINRDISWSNVIAISLPIEKRRKNKGKNTASAGRRECQSKACISSRSGRTRDNTHEGYTPISRTRLCRRGRGGRTEICHEIFRCDPFSGLAVLLGSCDWHRHQERRLNDLHHRVKTAGKQTVLLYRDEHSFQLWNIFVSLIVSENIVARLTLHNTQWYHHRCL